MSAREELGLATVRTPPWDAATEQSVIGAVLLDNAVFDRVGDVLRAEDFYDRRHRAIFEAIAKLSMANKPADVLTVYAALGAAGKRDDEFGGLQYLDAVQNSVLSVRAARSHAEQVRDYAMRRALIAAADDAASVAWQTGGTVSDKLEEISAAFSLLQRGTVKQAPKSLASLMPARLDRITELSEGKAKGGWPTHIPRLDRMLNGGLRPGGVYVLAARPSVGKSSLSEALALTLARDGLPTLFLSQEMPEGEVVDRALSHLGRLDYSAIQTGALGDEEWGRLADAVDRGGDLPLFVDDQPSLTLGDIRAKARLVKGLKVLVVDYLQLCTSSGKARDNRNSEVEELSRGCKALAKDMGVAVILLSQLNREVEKRQNRRPILADLRDSGAIEQDADVVLFLWPVRDLDENADRKLIGLDVAKNRQGARGAFGLEFIGSTQQWHESLADIDNKPTMTEMRRKDL
jgi:replicative DNA helicase